MIVGQYADFTQFPPILELQAGYCAWAENTAGPFLKGLYMVLWVSNTVHQWQYIGPGSGGGGSLLPDIRFVVGKAAYNLLDPGTATYLTIASALTAVTAYQTATGGLPVTIHLHPDTYAESPSLPNGVSMVGLSASPGSTVVAGTVTVNVGGSYGSSIGSLRCNDCIVDFGGASPSQCDMDRVEVSGALSVTQSSPAAASLALYDCSVESSASFLGSSLSLNAYQGHLRGVVVGGTAIAAAVSATLNGTRVSSSAAASIPLSVTGPGTVDASAVDCLWSKSNPALPVARLRVGASVKITGGSRLTPCSGFVVDTPDGTGRAWVEGFAGSTDSLDYSAGYDPLLVTSSALPTASGTAGVSASLTVVGGVTVPLYVMDRAADTTELSIVQSVPIDPVRAQNAFALARVPASDQVLDFRRIVFVNASSPADPIAGPVALIPSGTDTIGGLAGAAPNITSTGYVIVAPGDSIHLSRTSGGWRII